MAYDLHITRSPNWHDATDRITADEWRRIVQHDPDLEPYDPAEVQAGAFDPEVGYRLKGCEIDNCFLYDRDGTITIRRGYFEETLGKALQIAKQLGAVVQGDEGEYYRLTSTGRETTWDRPEPEAPKC